MIPVLALPAAALMLAAAAADPNNLCTLCHPDVRVQFNRSIHRAEEVTCVSCHGGDATASTVQAAHARNFRGKIRRVDVPALCASCHADPARMRPYNLPTDQYALYQTSQHGQRLAKGDEKVAVCIDCHGAHEILDPRDSRSSVALMNIPKTCSRCHSNAALMEGYGLKGDPYAEYAAGVHGEALLTRANTSAPDCTRCHGAHGATPPGVGDVDKVCGQCHATTRAHFIEGPHKAAMTAAGLPECASCHGPHRIMKADVALLGTICQQCHAADSPPVALGLKMKTLYTVASDELDGARALVARAAAVPLYTEDYQARLEEARTSLIEALPAMHSLDVARVEQLTARARSMGGQVESEVNGKLEERKWRRAGLLVFWFYLLVTIGILVQMRRRASLDVESGPRPEAGSRPVRP